MKKRNLKKLQLKKKSISKLYGGSAYDHAGNAAHQGTGVETITIYPAQTQGAEPGCAWYSELYTACECISNRFSNCMECPVEYDTRNPKHQAAV
ncbi:hypothetical protein [uncultured Kordia sp.]|uniref:hypothetical protein n=1 Tax=uncultured Kordia sp. TaxID=507699 RepID=UPI00260D4622|nr:hypothetical protein [uncultured Kordia sp.]